ncbi:MAG: helix-turn-helix domain-containing protein, partial [Candidatus Bathyarchaeia archaeon]
MVEEKDVVEFLKTREAGASLSEIAEGLGIPKYGPNSAYAILQTLKNKGIVERKGELWALTEEVKPKFIEKTPMETPTIKPVEGPIPKAETAVVAPEIESLVRAMAQTLAEAMKTARMPADEWELATKPMTAEIREGKEKLEAFVLRPDEAVEAKKPLLGFSTGTFLDNLFLTPEGKGLGGIPICGQFAITGLPGAGKSILVEEIAVR